VSKDFPEYAYFPEFVLQEVETNKKYKLDKWFNDINININEWTSGWPTPRELRTYYINTNYANYLIGKIEEEDKSGKALERLAHYLVSSMPGCRAYWRVKSKQTDYDVVGCFEGAGRDFRTEFGRYFLCECKDWARTVDFSAVAKFAYVLRAAKSGFGIIFSKEGLSGTMRNTDAMRVLVKLYQSDGIVIVGVDLPELRKVANGANFTSLLRKKYEIIRLDLLNLHE
jgi:hypothetical protein